MQLIKASIKAFRFTQERWEPEVEIAEAISVYRQPAKKWIEMTDCLVKIATQPGDARNRPTDSDVNHVRMPGSNAVQERAQSLGDS